MEERINILILEPDVNLQSILQESMQTNLLSADVFSSMSEAQQWLSTENYQLIVINFDNNHNIDLAALKKVKEKREEIPVIVISANPSKAELTQAYTLGADDYIRKPYSIEILQARIHAILRRKYLQNRQEIKIYQIGNYLFDLSKQTLSINGNTQKLTTKEFDLLSLFCSYPNQLIQRKTIETKIWRDNGNPYNVRSMDVYINKLRRLLKDDPNVRIHNVHGQGFELLINKPTAEQL